MNVPIMMAVVVSMLQHGPVIAILNPYAGIGHECTIHSSPQLEVYQNNINMLGYTFPINLVNGLPCVNMHPYTNEEWETLPLVIWTGDTDQDPRTILNYTLDDAEHWFDATSDLEASCSAFTSLFNKFGNYCKRVIVQKVVITNNAEYIPMFYEALLALPPSDAVDDLMDSIVYDTNHWAYLTASTPH